MLKRAHYAIFAVDRMSGRQERPVRLLTQDVIALGRREEEGRVGLPAAEPADRERPAKALDLPRKPSLKGIPIKSFAQFTSPKCRRRA
jgi:hypothetical protein